MWWSMRRGRPTASSFDKIITASTGKPSGGMKKYAAQLIADMHELHPPVITERPMSAAMRHGSECEPEARRWYTMETGRAVQQVGGCLSDCGRFWCSPDGLVGDDGALELKCPQLNTHAEYLIDGGLPDEYRPQVHGQLVVTGRAWVDFVSYAPGMNPLLVRVTPDEYTDKLRACLETFWGVFTDALAKVGGVVSKVEPEPAPSVATLVADYRECRTEDRYAALEEARRTVWQSADGSDKYALKAASSDCAARLMGVEVEASAEAEEALLREQAEAGALFDRGTASAAAH